MTGFVKIIFEASVTAGLAALAVILIRFAMKKAPKRWAYALWAVVFFRCLCPFSAESALSLFNVIPERAPEILETTETSAIVSEINTRPPVMERVETEFQDYGYTPYPVPVSEETFKEAPAPVEKPVNKNAVIFTVWAAGALAMTLYGVISYILLMQKLKTAVKTEEGVYESDLISTAFSAGFFPPKIYVPCGLFEEERKLIITHERVHIRRLDYIVKPVAFLGLAVHWFNPLIWLAFALMTRDMELSCDEAVLKIFGAGEKKAYSEALLHVSMKRSGLADSYKFMPLAFAETGIKGRVKNVLKYKKPTLIATVLAAAVVIAACAALGTNAKSKTEDMDAEIKYVLLQNDVNNCLTDAGGEEILLSKAVSSVPAAEKMRFIEGERSADSVTFTIGGDFENSLIMDIDITELKINALEIYKEDGRSFIKAEFNIVTEEDPAIFMRDDLIRLDTDKETKLFFVEGGGKKGVSVRAEYELEEDGSNGYSFLLYCFNDFPIYVNADLVKPETYFPIAEGKTNYVIGGGVKVCIDYAPDRNVKIADNLRKITFNAEPEEGSRQRSVLIGMRAKNNELNRQCGADFTGEEITGLAIDDISVSPDKFTVKFKITYPEGGGGFFANENEPNSNIRLVRGEDENVYYLYLTADYDSENVDEYAIDICGFDDIIPQINSKFNAAEGKAAEYTRIAGIWAEVTLETGETGYAAFDVNDIPINADDWTFSTKGIEGKGVSIGCLTAFDEGPGSMDLRSVLDFGDHPVTAITVENMYTERIGSAVKLYTEIKVTAPNGDEAMNKALNRGECEFAFAKLINDEYLFTIINEYNIHEDVTASFAVVVSGFDDDPVYINSALAPVQMPQIITYDSYKQIYGGEDVPTSYFTINYMDDNLTDEEKARIEEELIKNWLEEERKQRQEEEQRRREEEEQRKLEERKKLTEYEGAEKYGVDFIETAMKDGNVSAAYLNGTNVLILFDDGTFWYDIIVTSYSHFPHQTDHTLNDGVLVLNYDDGGALYFRQEDDKFIFDESSSKRGSKMEAPFFEDGYTLTSYETVVGGRTEEKNNASLTSSYTALQYPVTAPISESYGSREETKDFHKGVDFAVPEGMPVYAAGKGTVLNADDDSNGYGLCVIIDHGIDMATLYAHLSEISVKEGDEVNAGDLIGYSGKTGNTYEAALHFEVRVNGAHTDPEDYLCPVLSYPTVGNIYKKYGENGAKGISFDAPKGTEVYAAADGTVSETGSGWNGGYGTSVTISHGMSGMETVYAHLSEISVKEGDNVKKGDLIGYSGTTGDTAHQVLFFGVRINGAFVDPMNYLGLRHFDGDKYTK